VLEKAYGNAFFFFSRYYSMKNIALPCRMIIKEIISENVIIFFVTFYLSFSISYIVKYNIIENVK
jgi:hypothetical protein